LPLSFEYEGRARIFFGTSQQARCWHR
jgi:hypothetical protein